MAFTRIEVSGDVGENPIIYIRESTEPSSAPNRYIGGTIPGEIEFTPIADGLPHTYIFEISSISGGCKQTISKTYTKGCVTIPSVEISTNCASYNPTTNKVQIALTPSLTGSSQVRVKIDDGSTPIENKIVSTGTVSLIDVPANKALSIRLENISYSNCAFAQTYTAACSVPCAFSISASPPSCIQEDGMTKGVFNLTITDQNPSNYTYSVKEKGSSTERILSIIYDNTKFTPILDGQPHTYVVTVTKTGCGSATTEITLTCGTGGCVRLSATAYTLRTGGFISFADVCAKYCNNQYTEFQAWLSGITVGSKIYSLSTGCAAVSDGYYVVVDSSKQTIVIIRVQNGSITETQPACNCANPNLSVDISITQPTCTTVVTDATVFLLNPVGATKYRLCEGTIYTCSNDCTSALSLNSSTTETINGIVFGNSLTEHAASPELGWYGNWGMAASAADKDYLSILNARIKQGNPSSNISRGNQFGFETSYWNNFNYEGIRQQLTGKNLVLIMLGENVDDSQVGNRNLQARFSDLIDTIRSVNPNMKIIIKTSFWERFNYDTVVRNIRNSKYTDQSPITVVDISDMVNVHSYKAYTPELANASPAVKEHPGDSGMAELGNRSYQQVLTLFSPTSTNTTFIIQAPAQGEVKNYTLRIWNTLYGCNVYRDYPITITTPVCCVTYDVNTNSNANTTVTYIDCSNQNKSETISGNSVIRRICAKKDSVVVSGNASILQVSQGCDTTQPCSLSFTRDAIYCENSLPRVRFIASGGLNDNDYQYKIGNGNWTDFSQGRVQVITGVDNQTYTVQIRLKSNQSCIKTDTVVFNTSCSNPGSGCSKPTITSRVLGTPSYGTAYNSAVEACDKACNSQVSYSSNYFSINLSIGTTVYLSGNSNPNDCSKPVDGWYVGETNVYKIVGGIITEIAPHCFCGETPTLSPSTISDVQNDQTYTVNVGYNCTTTGVNVYKNGVFFRKLGTGVHSFTFQGSEVNNGDYFTAKTVCGSRESAESNRTTIQKGGVVNPPVEVCNAEPTRAGGTYNVVTKTFPITFTGNVFYMLSTGGIPDQLTVRKNGVQIIRHLALSWRVAGSVAVVPGDNIEFIVDGTVTGITGTGWTLYHNCTTPYNVNGAYDEDNGPVNNANSTHPTFLGIEAKCENGVRSFVVNASPASATNSPINRYKLLNNTAGSSDGQFVQATGWQTSNILTKTIGGNDIQAGKSYSVYVMDQSGSYTGISGVINNATCTSTSCDKTGLTTLILLRNGSYQPYGSAGEARTNVCSGNSNNINTYLKGSLVVGSRIFADNTTTNCNSIANGYYVTPDANFNPSKIIRVVDSNITELTDFTPCTASCPKTNLIEVSGRMDVGNVPYTSCADAQTKFCNSQSSAIQFWITSRTLGARVYFNSDPSNCNTIADGHYIHTDFANVSNAKIYRVVGGAIVQICNFNPC